MKNLIKAQLYQIFRTRVYLWVFLFFTALAAMYGSIEYLSGADYLEEGMQLTASDFATRMGSVSLAAIMGIGLFSACICCGDFSDKTCNYEIMSGRKRWQAYLARAVVSVAASVLFGLYIIAVGLGTSTLLTGWGDSIPVSAAVGRILLMTFPFFRISCFCTLLSYILKKPIFVFLAIYGMIFVVGNVSEEAVGATGVLTTLSNISMLCQYDSWYTFGLESGGFTVYDTTLEAAKIIKTIAASLAAGGLYLALGCSYFRGDDLN